MTTTSFEQVSRTETSAMFVDGRLVLSEARGTSDSFPCGVYIVDGDRILVINEPLDSWQLEATKTVTTPTWCDAIVIASVITGEESAPKLQVDAVLPTTVDSAVAVFVAACASYDDAFHDEVPLDCLVRVGGSVLRVNGVRDGTWAGSVSASTDAERREMADWHLYRGLDTHEDWCGWGDDGFRMSSRSPYDVPGIEVGVIRVGESQVAVIHRALTLEQRARLLDTPRPAWIDCVVGAELRSDPEGIPRIDVIVVEPANEDRAAIAAAVVVHHQSFGRFTMQTSKCVVHIAGTAILVTIDADWPADGRPPVWCVVTRPAPAS